MEPWLKHLCEIVGAEMGCNLEIPPHCTSLIDDCVFWYQCAMEQLTEYKKTKSFTADRGEIVFRIGDWRINPQFSKDSGWMTSRYKQIPLQKTEFHSMCMAVYHTMLQRLSEYNAKNGTNVNMGRWLFEQLTKRNLEYEFPSFYGR